MFINWRKNSHNCNKNGKNYTPFKSSARSNSKSRSISQTHKTREIRQATLFNQLDEETTFESHCSYCANVFLFYHDWEVMTKANSCCIRVSFSFETDELSLTLYFQVYVTLLHICILSSNIDSLLSDNVTDVTGISSISYYSKVIG